MRALAIVLLVVCHTVSESQVQQFPVIQNFDAVTAPALPGGWTTTTNRTSSGDFTATTSVPYSSPNAALSTNSTITQSLTSPLLDFSNKVADSLTFFERRSSTHTSGLILEASTDGGLTFPIQIADTFYNAGTTTYILRAVRLPESLDHQPAVKLQWRIVGNGTGTTGTFRLDDITITTASQFDAAIIGAAFLPEIPGAGDSVGIVAALKNVGRQSIQNIPVEFFLDNNLDAIPTPDEMFASTTVSEMLQPEDTIRVTARIVNLPGGHQTFMIRTQLSTDEHPSNDTYMTSVSVAFARQSVVINEIMYEPFAGQPEYVELYNRSPAPVNVNNWRIADEADTNTTSNIHVITPSSFVIGVEEYLVIASDSSIFARYSHLADSTYHVIVKRSLLSLNNDGDEIILSDLTRTSIDSVHYFPGWHNADVEQAAGRALERINPNLPSNDKRNWSTSASSAGGTPGEQNSLYTITMPTGASLFFSPNPFSPDGDGFEDVTVLHYELPSATGLLRARIYDASGRLVRALAGSEPSGAHGELIWDGYNDRHERARMGIYIVLLEALDGSGGEVQTVKGVVVVATKM